MDFMSLGETESLMIFLSFLSIRFPSWWKNSLSDFFFKNKTPKSYIEHCTRESFFSYILRNYMKVVYRQAHIELSWKFWQMVKRETETQEQVLKSEVQAWFLALTITSRVTQSPLTWGRTINTSRISREGWHMYMCVGRIELQQSSLSQLM